MKSLVIDYYTDVLCVWAWVAQRRIEELEQNWGERIDLRHHYLNLFGDTASRIGEQWSSRGGFEGFGQHVTEVAAPYDTANVNPEIWNRVRPASSANAHLVIKAVELSASARAAADVALSVRRAFFLDAVNIAEIPTLLQVVRSAGLDENATRDRLEDGTAVAALMRDYQEAQAQNISGSPSWVLDGGRQKLYGNVGYHVLHANIEGLLDRGNVEDASWC